MFFFFFLHYSSMKQVAIAKEIPHASPTDIKK